MAAEHILELQLIPRSIEFMVTGVIPALQGLPQYTETRPNLLLPWDITELLTQDYQSWPRAAGRIQLKGVPIDRIFHALGSTDNPKNLVNAEEVLNSMKGPEALKPLS